MFDDTHEDAAVSAYCNARAVKQAVAYIEVFRKQRKVLAPKQGDEPHYLASGGVDW